MTSQSHADALLAAWQLLRHIPAQLRLPMIDALIEIEHAKVGICVPRNHTHYLTDSLEMWFNSGKFTGAVAPFT